MADAAATLKQVTLELGGKSPLIVFGDAKLDNARWRRAAGNFYSAGECVRRHARVVHQERCAPPSWSACARAPPRCGIGDPMDPATQVGALISADTWRGAGFHRPRRRRARGCLRAARG